MDANFQRGSLKFLEAQKKGMGMNNSLNSFYKSLLQDQMSDSHGR